ncbi:MAG: hypothetical protein ACTSQP_00665 [Promethearchaeota archaeon]
MILNQIAVYLPNKPGQLSNLIEILMEHKIYIKSMMVAKTEDYGMILLLVDKFEKCVEILEEKDFIYSTGEVVAVKLKDNIGELYKISKLFGENKVNIDYLYSTLHYSEDNEPFALTVFKLDNNDKAVELLRKDGFNLLES